MGFAHVVHVVYIYSCAVSLCVSVCAPVCVLCLSLCVPVCADARDQPHIVSTLFNETESLACLELAEMGSLVESVSIFPDLRIQVKVLYMTAGDVN